MEIGAELEALAEIAAGGIGVPEYVPVFFGSLEMCLRTSYASPSTIGPLSRTAFTSTLSLECLEISSALAGSVIAPSRTAVETRFRMFLFAAMTQP